MAEETKKCGIVTLILATIAYFIMFFVLIGISVKVCDKVSNYII